MTRDNSPTPRIGDRPDRPDDPGYKGNLGSDGEGNQAKTAKRVDWQMYDAPRIWQMVANEGNSEAEDLVWAFSKISQYVDDTRLRLTDAATRLAAGWHGSPASEQAQVLLKEITDAMAKDTTAYVTATRELDNVVARLAESKQRIAPLYEQWLRLSTMPAQAGTFTSVVLESTVYKDEVEHTNESARDEMRRLDRDLEGARITTTDEFVPSTGVPSTNDLVLAGLGPQAIDAAHGAGGGMGRGLLSGGGMPAPAGVVPGAGGLVGAGPGPRMSGPVRATMPGVIGGDTTGGRPVAGGMMGGGMGGAHGGAGAGQGGGKADTQWETRHGVAPVIGAAPPPDPSTMGVDDSFDRQQRRK